MIAPIPIKYRAPDTTFPKGWYCVSESLDIGAGTLKAASCLGQQMVVYRTRDGEARVADAYCPHLGAHLASHDGRLDDGVLVCPFHKWRWDGTSGRCVGIPYTNIIPPNASLTLHPTREVDGMVLMWYHPQGAAPDHEPFDSSSLRGDGTWRLYDVKTWETTCPFRDILENLFDTAHITQLHHAAKAPEIRSMQERPHGLYVEYKMDPDAGEATPLSRLECNLSGVSLLTQYYDGVAYEALFVFSFTPIDTERFVQTSRLYLKDIGSETARDAIGKAFVERFVYEVEQDMQVLNFKKHLARPQLCAGDGPIMRFRQYATRYY